MKSNATSDEFDNKFYLSLSKSKLKPNQIKELILRNQEFTFLAREHLLYLLDQYVLTLPKIDTKGKEVKLLRIKESGVTSRGLFYNKKTKRYILYIGKIYIGSYRNKKEANSAYEDLVHSLDIN